MLPTLVLELVPFPGPPSSQLGAVRNAVFVIEPALWRRGKDDMAVVG